MLFKFYDPTNNALFKNVVAKIGNNLNNTRENEAIACASPLTTYFLLANSILASSVNKFCYFALKYKQ